MNQIPLIENKNNNIKELSKLDINKIKLSNEIINFIKPLVDKKYKDKNLQLENLNSEIKKNKKIIFENKYLLENLYKKYNKNKLVHKLLSLMEKVIDRDIVYEYNLRNEFVIILRVIESLGENKIEYHINDISKLLKKIPIK